MYRTVTQAAKQAGDTIVEVMFAVAIVGMVIAGSYVIATRALRTGRYAQEQTEALKQAETQLEKLKYLASQGLKAGNPNYIFDTVTTYCIDGSFNKVLSSTAACLKQGNGSLYDIAVTYSNTGGQDLFTVNVTWDRTGTTLKGSQQLSYRLHNAS